MRTRRPSAASTFVKYDKVNGRSYKTVRTHPRVGPTPDVMHTIVQPTQAVKAESPFAESQEDTTDEQKLDSYSDVSIEESLESDGISSWEASYMKGYSA